MRTVAAFTAAVGILIIALGAFALAVEVQRAGPTLTAPTRAKPMPLSTNECHQLGGKLVMDAACTSTFKCTTVDQYGKAHSVCINAITP
jgi:hypothetical protein